VLKVKLWDKLKALEMLGKHFGLFLDPTEHTRDGGPMTIEVVQQMSDEELEEALRAFASRDDPIPGFCECRRSQHKPPKVGEVAVEKALTLPAVNEAGSCF
jgi:hypothetical protein